MNIASIELPLGLLLLTSGIYIGITKWLVVLEYGMPTATGTVMLTALLVSLGVQFILAFLAYDISSVPKQIRHKKLLSSKK
jgi:dolichol-phosphate mannosyltransferase